MPCGGGVVVVLFFYENEMKPHFDNNRDRKSLVG